ncbi:MAG TPA: RsmE family RNA methyltransferase [Fimbriimonadaceae bacterium]|nr:RsmE family RNA methyltransferase [Fimbriimonadaceae bacterium]
MGRGDLPSLRSLPRVVIPGADPSGPIDLPPQEVEKFRKVLRLQKGDHIAILPNDGTLIRAAYQVHTAEPIEVVSPNRPTRTVLLAQALPKGDRLETVIRMGTELGVSGFVLFPADRSVVKWDAAKVSDRLRRLEAIAREATEQCYGLVVPTLMFVASFKAALESAQNPIVLDEAESAPRTLSEVTELDPLTLFVGPEGGWSPAEVALIGGRGVTLGERVLRTDTAGVAAAAVCLLGR